LRFETPRDDRVSRASRLRISMRLVVICDGLVGAPLQAFEEAKCVIAALKEQGASSVGAAGYCWGISTAKVVAELAKANEIQTAVISHPSFVTVDDIKVKCPIAILGAETDVMSPPELVKEFEQVL
ncbi:hypothetical protein ZWY2020_056006, partial [Hordeum vulgare]